MASKVSSTGVPLDRDRLIAEITAFLAGQDPLVLDEIGFALGREVDAAGTGALTTLNERLRAPVEDWTYYPRDPLAGRIHHVIADRIVEAGPS